MNKFLLRKLMNAEPGQEGGTPPAPEGTPPASEQQPSDWKSSLPEDIRNSPALNDFKDIGSLAKSFVDTQAYVGNSIRIPSEEASPEQRQEFIQKLQSKVPELMLRPNFEDNEQSKEFFRTLGMPESPEQYEVPTVENMELPPERADFLRNVAHKYGVTNAQFKGFMEEVLAADAQQMQQSQSQTQESIKSLRQEWGMAFDERMNSAKIVAQETGAPEALIQAIEQGNVGADVYKWLYQVGTQLGSEGMNTPGIASKGSTMSPSEASERVSEIMNNRQHPYWNSSHPEHKAAVSKMVELMKLAHPEQQQDVSGLRA